MSTPRLPANPRSTAEWYRSFAGRHEHGGSARYEDWALGVSGDDRMLALIESLPLQKRQPDLVFAVARLLGAPDTDYREFRIWLTQAWPQVAAQVRQRATQTNEPLRSAALLPALARIPGPLALLEIGASAGLCLYPDRYSYRIGRQAELHPLDGPSPVRLEASADVPVPMPARMPEIGWRAGIDLNPLDVRNAEDMAWLEALVPPGQHERRERIRLAADVARVDPPLLVRGDALDELAALAARVPPGLTLVIITSGVLVYFPFVERMRLVEAIRALDARWVSLEGIDVLPRVRDALHEPEPGSFVLALDQDPLAYVGPHGQDIRWFARGEGCAQPPGA